MKKPHEKGKADKRKVQALQGGLDCLDQFPGTRRGHAAESLDGLSILADQNLSEVPFDASFQRTFIANYAFVQRMTVRAVDVYLRVHRESHSVLGRAKFFDLFFGSGFLSSELIAWESANYKTLVLELLVQFFQALVLAGKSAFGCDVYHKDDFALVLGKGGFLTIDVLELVIVNSTCVSGR